MRNYTYYDLFIYVKIMLKQRVKFVFLKKVSLPSRCNSKPLI